ncbi:hypothetical protein ACOMHN_057913 [Nucella lapillus]
MRIGKLLLFAQSLSNSFHLPPQVQGKLRPKVAVQAIKKKIAVDNPHVATYALGKRPDPVKETVLQLIQTWANAFRNEPSYRNIVDNYHLLKMEGLKFPQLEEADAMFTAEKAPEARDGERCALCRISFSLLQRKYNCRNCGDVFCQKCSSQSSTIPKFGFEKEVRVCDLCFNKLKTTSTRVHGPKSNFSITKHFNCQTENVVYVINCLKCNKVYVSETGRTIATRFKEHLADINTHCRDKSIPHHFNQADHSISHVWVKGLWLMFSQNTSDRKDMESHLIDKLGSRKPHGLNEKP